MYKEEGGCRRFYFFYFLLINRSIILFFKYIGVVGKIFYLKKIVFLREK